MIAIQATVSGEQIRLTKAPLLANQTVLAMQVQFEFDEAWTGYGKIAYFWAPNGEVYLSQVSDGLATIPHEAMAEVGQLRFGVTGTKDGERLVTNAVKYNVVEGAYDPNAEESVDPSPDLLEQIESLIGEIESLNLPDRVTALERDTGAFDACQGELLHLSPSIDAPVRDIILYGKSTQNGTPAPDAPVPIGTAGGSGTLNVICCGKNIWNPTEAGRTVREVVWTKNADGTYTANGTANGGNSVFGTGTIYLPAGTTVVIKGCPSGGSSSTYNAYLWDRTTGNYPQGYSGSSLDNGEGFVYTVQESHLYAVNCRIMSGKTGSNLVFKPELYISSSLDISSEAYAGSTFPVTVPSTGLPGIAVSDGGNYTDSTGQQWVCDTIDLGKGVYTQRVGVHTFTSEEISGATKSTNTSADIYLVQIIGQSSSGINRNVKIDGVSRIKCVSNIGTVSSSLSTLNSQYIDVNETYARFAFTYGTYNTTTLDQFKAMMNGVSGGVTVLYPLIPVETPLTDTQLSQLRAISTRKTETYMYTDGGSGMYVENFVNEKELVDDVSAMISPAYSNVSTYAVGDYVTHDGKLYKCTTAIATAESWDDAHWTQTTVMDEIKSLQA